MVVRKGRGLLRKIKDNFKHINNRSYSFLTNLPSELIQAITTFLDTPKFCSLRLTCGRIYASTWGYFTRSYLHTVRTNLSLTALQRLQDLSQNLDLAPLVRKLVVKGRPEEDDFFGNRIVWELQHPSGYLSIPQKGVQQWQDVLRRLAHCRSFEFHNESCEIDNMGGLLTAGNALTLILSIIIEIQIPVVTFSVGFRHGFTIDFINMARIDISAVRRPEFITAWPSIQELSLKHTLQPATTDWVFQLVQHAGSLRKLQIDFSLGVLYALVIACGFPISPTRGHAQEIHLKGIFVEGGECIAIPRCLRISGFSTLEEINLFHLRDDHKLVNFSGVLENPIVDEEQGTKFTYISAKKRGEKRNLGVCYSGPKMDIA